MAATTIDRRPAVADTDSGKAAAREGVQAQAAGPRGRTRRFSAPQSDRRPSREAATFGIGAFTVYVILRLPYSLYSPVGAGGSTVAGSSRSQGSSRMIWYLGIEPSAGAKARRRKRPGVSATS
jgi:hypothetical protein